MSLTNSTQSVISPEASGTTNSNLVEWNSDNFDNHPDVLDMANAGDNPTIEQLRKAYIVRDHALCSHKPIKDLMLSYLKQTYMRDEERKNKIHAYINNTENLDMMTFYKMLTKSELYCIGW